MYSIGQNIRRIRELKSITQREIAEHVGVKNTTVSNWETDRSTPQAKDLFLISRILGVTIEAITNGVDDAIKVHVDPRLNIKLVDFLPISAYAKFVEQVISNEYKAFEQIPVYYTKEQAPTTKQIVIEVTGSSMEPTLYEKSHVLFEKVSENDIKYINSGIYSIVFDSQFVIKRVKENELMTKGELTLYSDNPQGGAITVPHSEIRAVWKAIDIVRQRLR